VRDNAEKDELIRVILDCALDPADFVLVDQQKGLQEGALYPAPGTVIIRRLSTNVEHTYNVDHNHMWSIEFSDDIHAGLFLWYNR
jgi:hypothetical protein